jgi:hypothetical protein
MRANAVLTKCNYICKYQNQAVELNITVALAYEFLYSSHSLLAEAPSFLFVVSLRSI